MNTEDAVKEVPCSDCGKVLREDEQCPCNTSMGLGSPRMFCRECFLRTEARMELIRAVSTALSAAESLRNMGTQEAYLHAYELKNMASKMDTWITGLKRQTEKDEE